jgi:hypothetical protein
LNGYSVFLVFAVIAVYFAQVFAIPFGQALFMSPSLGSVGQRFQRAMRPWALAQVGLQTLGVLAVAIFAVVFTTMLLPSLHTLIATAAPDGTPTDAASQSAVGGILGTFGILFLFSIPAAIYGIAMQVQPGAVGAAMNRWAVFGINLLTSVVLGFVLGIVFNIIGAVVFHSAFNFTTTAP